ncbi:hypothetical protein [Providencia stuartii]|uniref:hypothetical protein n=1 Tax=Providencia stuartii TaxID=588 RepID=UPI002AA0B262|nr:hypothetical protein [Providencia stuartii]
MKMSELIQQLQDIDKTIPFDADVVTGDDFLPCEISRVYHNPPRTYIQFESYEEDEWSDDQENNRLASIAELSTRAHMIEQMVEMIENNPSLTKQDIIKEFTVLSQKMHGMIGAIKNT